MITAEEARNNRKRSDQIIDNLLEPIYKQIETASVQYSSIRITREEFDRYGWSNYSNKIIERLHSLGYQIIFDRYDDIVATRQNCAYIEIRWDNFKTHVHDKHDMILLKPPSPPPSRIIQEGVTEVCTKCGSSCFKDVGCIQPLCINFYGRTNDQKGG